MFGTTLEFIEGATRSLDYSLYVRIGVLARFKEDP